MDDDSPTPPTQSARRRQIERRLKRARRNLTTAITERSAAISDAHEAGISLRDIATHVGISYSGVDKIIKRTASLDEAVNSANNQRRALHSMVYLSWDLTVPEPACEVVGQRLVSPATATPVSYAIITS